jgi:lambda family phage minor tail protein L
MDLFHLFTLDVSSIGGDKYYFHEYNCEPITYLNNSHFAIPIETDGFEITSKGLPTPTIKVSNILGLIGTLVRTYDGLQGAKITRTTLVRQSNLGHLYTNADRVGSSDIYIIDRPTAHTNLSISFELRSIFDLNGNRLPRRTILQSTCPLIYGSAECGVPVTALYPTCPRNIDGCLARVQFQTGQGNPALPIGSFPAVNKFAS